ncbi:trans-aconitate 2-methyltransferase [Sorangium cellulosum]|jgi:trans-aconitate 2-methyltransferase|uniref:Trans-aconitate 2-methyltransferase n=1 Tax=Sorangium cellulosum TaxID=56 RepID=A0A4P2Q5B4_SORCE|nr:methyltransferase domain-containing protein [Sorangium cellulosum]AUX24580.1 trans-aconitate 2-methyltransferase [Sorangium cellulosum]
MPWNPDRYHQFQAQRSAPFDDLLALVHVRPGLRVADLGCGTGELTRCLADVLPGCDALGLDLSPEMLERARAHARPGLRFEQGDQAALRGTWDLIFSNAALQWSEDHAALLPRLFACLAPGGQLAVQVPSNHAHVSYRTVLEIAGQEPFRGALGAWTRTTPVLPPEAYADILFRLGAEEIVVFEKVYPHVLRNAQAVVDWISGTVLVPYFERLPEALRSGFSSAILTRLQAIWPEGPVFYPFKRIFFSAVRPR